MCTIKQYHILLKAFVKLKSLENFYWFLLCILFGVIFLLIWRNLLFTFACYIVGISVDNKDIEWFFALKRQIWIWKLSSKTEICLVICIYYAPLRRRGGILFCTCRSVRLSVGPSTTWFPDDNSRMLRPGITKLHRGIGHDRQMTPIDFQVTRSKVKFTVTWSSKMVSGW